MKLDYLSNCQLVGLSKKFIACVLLIVAGLKICFSQCPVPNAGPDLFTCDPTMPVQLMGSFTGMPMKYYWTPVTYLSDPNILNPFVNAPVGKYKYTLNVEALATINLIFNGDFELGNTGFTHDYIYGIPGGTFLPGYLGVGPSPIAYNKGWANCGDHTTGTGNQLIVDGSLTPNSSLWCQTVAVTAGKMYLFRFYVQSVVFVAPAQLIAKADGATIGSVSAAASCDWQMFEACFTATSGSVKMCIIETSCIGNGDDFAVDDIEMYEKCLEKDEVEVEVVDLKTVIQVPKLPKCSSDIFDLKGVGSSTGPNIKYEWRSEGGIIVSQNGLSAKGVGSGKYFLKVIYKNGNVLCEKEVEIDITASDDLEGTLEVEGIANCKSDTIILTAITSNGSGKFSYLWIPPNKILRGQNESVAYVTESGIYKVVITDLGSGCETEIQNIVVSDTLSPNLQISGDSLISCLNNQVLLFGNPFDTSKYSYEWLLPDSSRIKNKDSIFSKDAGVFSLKIKDKLSTCYTTKTWNVNIDTIKPNIYLGQDLKIDCIHTDVTILPTGNNSNVPINYYWTLPSGSLPIDTSLQNQKETKAGNVYLRLVNTLNGCEVSDTILIEDLRKIPNVDAGIGTTLNCKIIDYTLDASNTKTDSTNYFWSTQNGNIVSGANTLNPSINTAGWYYLNLEDTINHCKNIDSVLINQNILAPNSILGPDKIFTCADTILAIDGSGSSQGAQLKYHWLTNNGNIDSGQGSQFIKIKSAGDYFLIVIDTINFCSDTSILSVKPDLNAPVAGISVNDTLTCLKTSVNLFGNASSPAGNAIKFSWNASAGQLIQNANSLTPIVNEAGEYILTVIDQVNGCSVTVKINVNIDTIKPVTDTIPNTIWYCNTTKLTLDESNASASHGLQFQWSTTNGIILSDSQQRKIDIGGPGNYSVKVIDLINGCESTNETIVVKDYNTPDVDIQTPDTITCIKNYARVWAWSPGYAIKFSWNTKDGEIVGPDNLTYLIARKPGTYQLIATDTISGCTDQDSIVVYENKQKPIVNAGVSEALNCQILDLILTGTITNFGSNSSKWKTNQGNILTKSDSIQIKINKPGIYYLEVTDFQNGCVGLDSVLVTKINNLVVDAGGSTELTCRVKDATLSASIQNGAGNETISWTTNQGHFIGNANTLQVKADLPGWYYFVVTNNITGCDGMDSVLIFENTNLPVSLNLDIEQPKCPGESWQTEVTNIVGGEKPFQIYFDNQLINGLTMQGNSPGNYLIKVIDKNGCELATTFDIINPQGVTIQLIPLVRLFEGDDYNLIPMYSIPDDSIAEVQWSPANFLSCTDCPYPVIKGIGKDIEYIVSYTNRNGCIATARIRIELIKKNIWVPNVFSPNGDNINDWFFPVVTEDSYKSIRLMSIYDRWGNEVFTKENFQPNTPTEGWNGEFQHQKMNPGVYVYIIEVEWKNGERQLLKGDLTLMR